MPQLRGQSCKCYKVKGTYIIIMLWSGALYRILSGASFLLGAFCQTGIDVKLLISANYWNFVLSIDYR